MLRPAASRPTNITPARIAGGLFDVWGLEWRRDPDVGDGQRRVFLSVVGAFWAALRGLDKLAKRLKTWGTRPFREGRVSHCHKNGQKAGAGEGNRTLVVSLGSFCSTIELDRKRVV